MLTFFVRLWTILVLAFAGSIQRNPFLRSLAASFQGAVWAQMASVQLSDVIIPAVYMSYTGVDNPELSAFFASGVAVRNSVLDNAFTAGGTTCHMPFWNDIDPTVEPNYSTDLVTDVAVPNKITATDMIARVVNSNQAYSAADLVMQLAGSSPMQRIRDRFSTYWLRQWQRRCIATCQGVLANNIASFSSDMVLSVALETTVGVTSANLFNRANFVGAIATLGDQFAKIVAIGVHSVVYQTMLKNDDIAFIRPSVVDPNIPLTSGQPYFLGKPVVVDDTLPVVAGSTSGFKYTSILFGQGAIGYGENLPPVPVEVYRRPDQGNGGGIEQLWERKSMVIHPFGFTFTSSSIAGQSATIAELKLAANWNRVVVRKNVPLAFLITNG